MLAEVASVRVNAPERLLVMVPPEPAVMSASEATVSLLPFRSKTAPLPTWTGVPAGKKFAASCPV